MHVGRKTAKKLVLSLLIVGISSIVATPAFAADTVTCSPVYSSPIQPDEQWRYITVIKDAAWTPLTPLEGQPTNGTYVRVGDQLFNAKGSHRCASISFALGEKTGYENMPASVTFKIPITGSNDMAGAGWHGVSKPGYYTIDYTSNIKPTITLIQYRHKKNGYLESGEWGAWEKAQVYLKTYETLEIRAEMVAHEYK